MRLRLIIISLLMHFKMLLRRKIVLILLAGIPCLFIFMVHLTSSSKEVLFQLGVASEKTFIRTPEINMALVFVTMATIGFLSSFLSLSLVQQNKNVNRRLIVSGYHSSELILSVTVVIILMIFLLVVYIGLIVLLFFQPMHTVNMMLGLFLTGLIYGGYGMMIASLVKGELEGTLLVILLANIDAGWLQNPLFFAEARNKLIIQALPAYSPSQVAIASAFTNVSIQPSLINCVLYTIAFTSLAIVISYYKMRINSNNKIISKMPN